MPQGFCFVCDLTAPWLAGASWAAAGFTCTPIHADTIAIAILEGTRMIASQQT
jgi:hypothetical protein